MGALKCFSRNWEPGEEVLIDDGWYLGEDKAGRLAQLVRVTDQFCMEVCSWGGEKIGPWFDHTQRPSEKLL